MTKRTKKVEVTEVPEGMTGAEHALISAIEDSQLEIDPMACIMVDNALEFLAKGDEVMEALHDLGATHLMTALVTIGSESPDTALRALRQLMRQLTKSAHFRLRNIERQHQYNAQNWMNSDQGVDGASDTRGIDDLIQVFGEYPAGPDDQVTCTPNEQLAILENLQALLNILYTGFQRLKFSWMPTKQLAMMINDLPFSYSSKDKYVEFIDLHEALLYLDEQDALRVEASVAQTRSALDKVKSLKL
jgi:hypothetical protein